MNAPRSLSAMPEDHDAIRVRIDSDEPPAVMFHEHARPGALVSWAWSQLMALNSMLDAIIDARTGRLDGPDIAGAVQAVLVPVMNALNFSEERAHQLRSAPVDAVPPEGEKRMPKKKKTARRI